MMMFLKPLDMTVLVIATEKMDGSNISLSKNFSLQEQVIITIKNGLIN